MILTRIIIIMFTNSFERKISLPAIFPHKGIPLGNMFEINRWKGAGGGATGGSNENIYSKLLCKLLYKYV